MLQVHLLMLQVHLAMLQVHLVMLQVHLVMLQVHSFSNVTSSFSKVDMIITYSFQNFSIWTQILKTENPLISFESGHYYSIYRVAIY